MSAPTRPTQLVDDALNAQQDYSGELECGWNQNNCRPALEAACDSTRQALIDALTPSPAPVQPETAWPKLDKPAAVGGGVFRAGVSSLHVIEAAQRWFEHEAGERAKTPTQLQADEANRRTLWDMIHGAPVQPQAEPAAFLLTRQSGFQWAAMPHELSIATIKVLNAENVTIKPLYAGAAPVAKADPDAARFVYLMSDLAGSNRVVRNALLDRLAVMSYSAGCVEIDAAMKGTP